MIGHRTIMYADLVRAAQVNDCVTVEHEADASGVGARYIASELGIELNDTVRLGAEFAGKHLSNEGPVPYQDALDLCVTSYTLGTLTAFRASLLLAHER